MANNKFNDNQVDAFGNTVPISELPKFTDDLLALKGKIVECYIGDQGESIEFNDFSIPVNCVIIGRLCEVMDRAIQLDCYFIDQRTGALTSGHLVWINSFQLRVMTELNGVGRLNDIFLNSKSSEKVRKAILSHNLSNKIPTKK
jgi:hypothetical protein